MSFIKDVYKQANLGQTVFSLLDFTQVNPAYTGKKLNSALKYLVKNNDLIRISKGLYAINDDFIIQEYANKLRNPSYISLYTVLFELGVVFQPYNSIYVISQRSETKVVKNIKIIYKKIKDEILFNPLGIESKNGVFKATLERAICDKIYLGGVEYFDNLRSVDFEKMKSLNKEVYSNNKNITKWISQNTK